jgi:hypothetical protein
LGFGAARGLENERTSGHARIEDERPSSKSTIGKNLLTNPQTEAAERFSQSPEQLKKQQKLQRLGIELNKEQLRKQLAGSSDLPVLQSRRDHENYRFIIHSAIEQNLDQRCSSMTSNCFSGSRKL